MCKYIIVKNLNFTNQHTAGSDEELACEIASRILLDNSDASDFYAIKENNRQKTFEFLKKNALCSLEINDENKKIWNSEILKIYQKEKELQDCIEKAWFASRDICLEINLLGESKTFSNFKMHEDFSLDFHFSSLDDTAHVELSEDLQNIFEYKFISD